MGSLFSADPQSNGGADGEARRDAALDLLLVHRGPLIRQIQAAAVRTAIEQWEVCADDVRALVPIPDGVNPKVVGAVFASLGRSQILQCIGFKKSTRPEAHARPIGKWRLANRSAAIKFLVELERNIATDSAEAI